MLYEVVCTRCKMIKLIPRVKTRTNIDVELCGTLCFDVDLTLLEDEVLADHSLPDVLNVLNDCLEVRCSVVRASDEDVVLSTRGCRGIQWGH